MPKGTITWQARGQYLAECCGMTPQQFAAGLDAAMGHRQGIAPQPAAGQRTRTGGKARTRSARAKQTAAATN